MRRRVGGLHTVALCVGKKAHDGRFRVMGLLHGYESASLARVLNVRDRGATHLGVSSDESHGPKEDSSELHVGVCMPGLPFSISLSFLYSPSSFRKSINRVLLQRQDKRMILACHDM